MKILLFGSLSVFFGLTLLFMAYCAGGFFWPGSGASAWFAVKFWGVFGIVFLGHAGALLAMGSVS